MWKFPVKSRVELVDYCRVQGDPQGATGRTFIENLPDNRRAGGSPVAVRLALWRGSWRQPCSRLCLTAGIILRLLCCTTAKRLEVWRAVARCLILKMMNPVDSKKR